MAKSSSSSTDSNQSRTVHSSERVVVELRLPDSSSSPSRGYTVRDTRGAERDFRLKKDQHALCAMGESGSETVNYADIERGTETKDIQEQLEIARDWGGKNLFLQMGLGLQFGFCNFGFRLKPEKKAGKEYREWWKRNEKKVRHLLRETWEDWLLMDNAVAFWRRRGGKDGPIIPSIFTLPPERCTYTDFMGIEKLKVRMDCPGTKMKWNVAAGGRKVQTSDPNSRMIERYSKGEVELSEAEGEFFQVLKRQRVGYGFAKPRLYSLFRTMAQWESMEVSDNLWAFLSRAVTRHFKLGHEIRNGPKAGHGTWFWDPERSDAILKFFGGRVGILDYTSNFDQIIEFPFPSLDRFKKEKYESAFQRVATWLGPIGLILFAKTPHEFMLRLLKGWVEEQRHEVRMHCETIINEVLQPPSPVTICWSNKIFTDLRQMMEMVKFLLTAGPLSQKTALEESGFEQEEEQENKTVEDKLARDSKTQGRVLPLHDPYHNKGGKPGDEGGRPTGQTDGGPRKDKEAQ